MEVYQVLRVDLVGVKHHKDLGVPGVVHAAVVQIHVAAVFRGGPHVLGVPVYVIADQHAGQKHRFARAEQAL